MYQIWKILITFAHVILTTLMKKNTLLTLCGMLSVAALQSLTCSVQAQTSRSFVLPNSEDGQSEIHISLPEKPSGRAIVCCPGGGYTHLAFEKEGTNWAPYFNAKGIALITLKYRMPNGDLNIPLSDAYHAMRVVRDSAAVWGINPYDVGIMGSSAGGHLAATVSTHASMDVLPNFTLLFYPVITLGEGTHEGSARGFLGDKRDDKEMIRLWSANKQVRHYMTPTALLLLSNDDKVVPPVQNGVAYYSAMRNEGLDCTMHIYPDGGHGWGYADYFTYKPQMLDDLSDWLDRLPHTNPEAIRVSCIGNSITHGHGIDMKSRYGYPAQLQKLLGTDYNVKNFGYSSRTLSNSADLPYMNENNWRYAQDFLPNVVVIKLGTNDTKPHNWEAVGEKLGVDPVVSFKKDLQCMLDTLKALPTHPRILLCTPLPAYKESWGIRDSVIVGSIIPAIQEVAGKNDVEIIDLHSVVTERSMIMDDGIHPNEKGCKQMAEIIAEKIKSPAPVIKATKKNRRNKK